MTKTAAQVQFLFCTPVWACVVVACAASRDTCETWADELNEQWHARLVGEVIDNVAFRELDRAYIERCTHLEDG